MTRGRGGRSQPDQEARFRKALGGAAAPAGLRERILAALDEEDRARRARRPEGANRRRARRRPPSRRP